MTTWRPNEPTANARTCLLEVVQDDGTPAPPGTNFSTLGYLFFGGATLPSLAIALGTLANVRRALTWAPFTFTVPAFATGVCHAVAHKLKTGDGLAIPSNAGGALPGGLTGAGCYVIYVDADNFKLASTLANAYAGVNIALTSNGTGVQTLTADAAAQRGVAGQFLYTATQGETTHTFSESQVMIDGPVGSTYERANGGGALTLVGMEQLGSSFGSEVIAENSLTRDDLWRLAARGAVAPFTKVGNNYTWMKIDGTGPSHTATVTSAGRSAVVIVDPT